MKHENKYLGKILFSALFIPYLLLIVLAIDTSFSGAVVGLFGNRTQVYGAEAYSSAFVFTLFRLWYLFAACAVGQLVIAIIEKCKRKVKILPYILAMLLIYLPPWLVAIW